LRRDLEDFSLISKTQRQATAKMIWDKENSPDIMALMEVENLDYILLSKKAAANISKDPWIDRRGLAKYTGLEPFYPASAKRILPSVDKEGTEASDHCPVFVEFNI
jgi:endonuclease/exonuclease/phosphatase family metal-dependent hydrolase